MVWVGRDIKAHLIPALPLPQAAPMLVQPFIFVQEGQRTHPWLPSLVDSGMELCRAGAALLRHSRGVGITTLQLPPSPWQQQQRWAPGVILWPESETVLFFSKILGGVLCRMKKPISNLGLLLILKLKKKEKSKREGKKEFFRGFHGRATKAGKNSTKTTSVASDSGGLSQLGGSAGVVIMVQCWRWCLVRLP